MSIIGHGVISRKAGERTEVEEIELDSPGPRRGAGEIQASGVCHTDLHYKLGKIGDESPISSVMRARESFRKWGREYPTWPWATTSFWLGAPPAASAASAPSASSTFAPPV